MSKVSVVIVNYNGREVIGELLESLARQTRPADEILVVDNASSDGSADLVRQRFPRVRQLPLRKNVGFAAGVNAGAELAAGEYLALINSDVVLDPACLEELSRVLDTQADVAAAVPKIYRTDNPRLLELAGAEYNNLGYCWGRGHKSPDSGEFDRPGDIAAATACVMLLRRSALAGEPVFDPALFMYYEEFDLTLRIRGRGYGIRYVPTAVAHHKGMFSVRKEAADPEIYQQFLCNRNRLKILFKYYPISLVFRGLPLTLLGLSYWNAVFLRRGGPVLFLKSVGAQARFVTAGLLERSRVRRLDRGRWMQWMQWHGLKELRELRRQHRH